MKLNQIMFLSLVLMSAFSLVNSTYVISNYGTSFYLGFMRQVGGIVGEPRIIIGTNSTTTVNFLVTSDNSTLSLGGVTSSSSTTVPLSVSWLTTNSSYSERHKGVHISASAPIYVLSSLYATGGAVASHLVFPGHQLDVDTYEYIAVSYQTVGWVFWSLVLLVGNEDNTSITVVSPVTVEFPINPQDPTSGMFQLQAGFPHTVTLNKLQTLLFGSNGIKDNDMTGTRIISNKPLTVISGNECAFVPAGIEDCEQIAIQIPPVVTWGKDFLLPPVFGRTSGQFYKVIAAHSKTTVNLTCTDTTHQPTTLSAVGSFVELNTSSSDYCHLESSSPVLVVQLSFGHETDGTGDPFMILIPSINQYSNDLLFRTPTGHDLDLDLVTHFLSVVATSADFSLGQIVYDGQPISCSVSAIRSSNGSVVGYGCGFNISAGDHNLRHTDKSKSILGLAYGYVQYRAYGFPIRITHRLKSSVQFSQLKYTLLENQGVISIDVMYVGVPETNVIVKLVLGNESSNSSTAFASPGTDFQLLSEEVTFAAGETAKSVSVVVYDDEWVEFSEEFSIRLLPEDELLLGSQSFFHIEDNDNLHVGITSAITTTSPYYTLEICVCVTSGVLQSGITISVSLTAAIQGQASKKTIATELQFSQNFIKHCPQLNLLSLVDEAELTSGVTLIATLSTSDAVHITLSPNTTEINVMEAMTSTLAQPDHTSITLSSTPRILPSSMPQVTHTTTLQPISTAHQTMDTAVAQSTEASLYTLIAVVIGGLSVCFITTIIAATVIAGCYCQRAKSQRMITNSLEQPVMHMVNHAYSGTPHAGTGIYEFIKTKTDPLPDPPAEEQYEDMSSISYPAGNAQTKTYINMI